jgi:CHAT domain-containing protein
VLAACNTAGGHVRDGEGVVGLSWAFLAAGCRNTVVSQWSVDSAATMRLMIDFHRAYAAGASPAAALRRAQLAMRHDPRRAHPFYWAPFVVIGAAW